MNKQVNAIGHQQEIQMPELEKIVKQGTIAGPMMAGVSTDKINKMKNTNCTMYGQIEIKEPAFVDDIAGMGTAKKMKEMARNMQTLEELKKFTFNNNDGKTNYMLMQNNKEELELTVKTGKIKKTEKYKYMGDVYTSPGGVWGGGGGGACPPPPFHFQSLCHPHQPPPPPPRIFTTVITTYLLKALCSHSLNFLINYFLSIC